MNFDEIKDQPDLILKPSCIYAFLKAAPLMLLALLFLFVAYWLYASFMWLSLATMIACCYRFIYIRNISYLLNVEVMRISTGIISTRLDSLEMYRIKDYVITQPLILRVFKLMNLTLKTTDPENKTIILTGIPVSDIIDTIREHVQKARQNNRIVELN